VWVVSDEMETNPLMFNYFGSKQRLASTYQRPLHNHIIEPFAGAAGYTVYWMTRHPTITATLIEKDPDIYDLWMRLLGMSADDIMAIPSPVRGERTSDLFIALTAGASNRLSASGDAQVTEWMAREPRFHNIKRRVARTRAFIGDRIRVIHDDYTWATGNINQPFTWFIDPPYQHQGNKYAYGSDMIDYQALAEFSQTRAGQTIVCEAAPADWLPFTPHKTSQDQVNQKYTELVWYSDPEPTLFDMEGGT